jgi:hypothetical protein
MKVVEKVAEAGTKEVMDAAVGYAKEFVEALTPIAQKAYETGLLTLQIDAAQGIVSAIAALVIGALGLRKIIADYRDAKRASKLPENRGSWVTYYLPLDGMPHIFIGMACSFGLVIGACNLLSIWLWVKLFSPDLWLAHQAVEKLLK